MEPIKRKGMRSRVWFLYTSQRDFSLHIANRNGNKPSIGTMERIVNASPRNGSIMDMDASDVLCSIDHRRHTRRMVFSMLFATETGRRPWASMECIWQLSRMGLDYLQCFICLGSSYPRSTSRTFGRLFSRVALWMDVRSYP